jgi:hypothetical protein
MPRIPLITDLDHPELQPIKEVRQSTNATPAMLAEINGAGRALRLGEAISNFGQKIGETAQKTQDLEDLDRVSASEAQLLNSMTEFQVKSRERQGKNAFGLETEARQFYENTVRDISSKLTPSQQTHFQQIAIKRIPAFRGEIQKYESQQREASARESFKAQRDASALAVANNPMAADQELQRTRASITAEAAHFGWNEETRTMETLKATTALHLAALFSIEKQSPELALRYLEANADGILPDLREKTRERLQGAERERKTETINDNYELLYRSGKLSPQAWQDTIRNQHRGDDEKVLLQDQIYRVNLIEANKRDEQTRIENDVWKLVNQGASLAEIKRSNEWQSLTDEKQRTSFIKYFQNVAAERSAKFPSTDWDLYTALRQKALNDPEEFKKMDLRTYFPQLGKGERESLLDLKGKADKPDHLKDVATLDQQIGAATEAVDIKKEDKGRLRQAIYTDIDAIQKRTGKALTQDERQKRIDYWLVEGEIPGLLNDQEMRRFQAKGVKGGDKWVGTGQKFQEGKVYTDGNGVRRRYHNGNWEKP